MKCEYCGRILRPEDIICPGCGAPIELQETEQSATINLDKTGGGQRIEPIPSMQSNVRYAGFWIRVVASLIDSIVILIAGAFTAGIGFWASIIYYIVCEAYWDGSTIGKKAVGIQVVNSSFEKVSLKEAVIRNLSKIVSGLIIYIGFIMVIFNGKKRALHDIIAETYVIYKN